MKRTASSKKWLKEHFDDPYVKQAQKMGYRARAAFKLLEIQEKDSLIKPGMIVVDLGAAPGGWTQVLVQLLKGKGQIYALDILPMEPLLGATIIQADFREEETVAQLLEIMNSQKPDVILSDMAPNIGGIGVSDQAKSMYLAEIALEFSKQTLKTDGDFLVKVFQGAGFDEYLKALRQCFHKVFIRKPKASRDRSKEVYLLARGFKTSC